MPLVPPALDDRSFDDLVEEALSRIPAHTPEWTNPRLGDPGRTLIELFAWLTDTLLYRANLIPERQRLAFLRLLDVQMRPATPARGLVSVSIDDEDATQALYLQPLATLKGPVTFETASEMTVLPIKAEAYYKRPLKERENTEMAGVLRGLQQVYRLNGEVTPYVTTPLFAGGAADAAGFDLAEGTVDKCIWLALLASKKELKQQVRESLGANEFGGQQLINVGVMPSIETPALFEQIGARAPIPHVWEISSVNSKGEVEYHALDVASDSTAGLTRRGVMRLVLPATQFIGAPSNDVRASLEAGVGDRPPRLDVKEIDERLVAWLRLRPTVEIRQMSLSWVGVNAIEIDQRRSIFGHVVGQSDGTIDQQMQLPAQSVDPATLQVQVEESGMGYQPWRRIDDLALAGRGDAVYSLDGEAGTIRFGDGVKGRIPEAGRRVRVAMMRAGGGRAGNLSPRMLTEMSAKDLSGRPVNKLKVLQALATDGGEDAETLAEAERRIPALFRHHERAVTEDDFRRLAANTPGVRVGRVELLKNFKPQQRRSGVAGVVSVMVMPFKAGVGLPNPRPDRPFLESVHAYLDARRPLTTEMYVIGCEYVALGVSVGLTVRDGFDRTVTINMVRETLKRYLWPLAPGGNTGTGWQLGRPVIDRELEVTIARVPGVNTVAGVNLFQRRNDDWAMVARPSAGAAVRMDLRGWQLPELLSVVVVADQNPPNDLRGVPNPFGQKGVAIPVVPEVC